jgi:hypothetical protein
MAKKECCVQATDVSKEFNSDLAEAVREPDSMLSPIARISAQV